MFIFKMNIRYYLLIGLVLSALKKTICNGYLECPNAPVTPYPLQKSYTNCPNTPISPSPEAVEPSMPVSPCPSIPNITICFNNQQTNWPVPLTNSPCLHCQTATAYPCTTKQTNCTQTHICINQLLYPSPITQCGATYIGCSSTAADCKSTNTSCNTPPTCCNQQPSCPPAPTTPSSPSVLPETPKTYEPPTTLSPPPAPIIKCPSGTQLMGNECHLLYCPRGSEMVNDRCVVIQCPKGTVWIGHRCSVPEPVVQNITFYSTIVTQFNQTKPDIIINNTNNIIVDASNKNDCNTDYGNCEDEVSTTEMVTIPSSPCCAVMTPRMCEQRNNRWRCYSRRSRRCGDFCIAPVIYLRPPRVQAKPPYVVIPPIEHNCQLFGTCGPVRGAHDCSGCALGIMERCSHYCYRYTCPSRTCNFYDQERYCYYNSGLYGCQEEDGCLDNWCQ